MTKHVVPRNTISSSPSADERAAQKTHPLSFFSPVMYASRQGLQSLSITSLSVSTPKAKGQRPNGKWQMANGKWQMANGKWQMANAKRRMLNGKMPKALETP